MRTVKPLKRQEPAARAPEFDDDIDDFPDEEADVADLARVRCPDCAQAIAPAAPGGPLPVHALCPTPWNPFGLTVCAGSGRVVADDGAAVAPAPPACGDGVLLAALPEGLDWRLQPFSHAVAVDSGLRQAA
ncbi:hypothetical protein [Streptomyces marincola]|uniref:hypothetical protein n=1 Tax=Streptomyces marincola TaxID=2878388 RepID=UPI001CF3FE4A|nr:hypothetical protein [Streptomyces marincola]UCM86759.1 hypothetical protein LC193_01720 [Streptomyces marincola]